MRVLALLLLLQGCAGQWMPMDCTAANVTLASITWVRTDDPYAVCKRFGIPTLERGGACIQCYRVENRSACVLYANDPRTINEIILGHEVREAFGCKHG